MRKGEKLPVVIACVLIVVVLTVIVMQASDCNDSGGKFVRGLIWFECVKYEDLK